MGLIMENMFYRIIKEEELGDFSIKIEDLLREPLLILRTLYQVLEIIVHHHNLEFMINQLQVEIEKYINKYLFNSIFKSI